MNRAKKFIFSKTFSLIIMAAAFVYGIILPFCWGNNPADTYGTISLLCEHRQVYMWIWTMLMSIAFYLNSHQIYRKYNYKNKLLDVISALSVVGAFTICITLNHSIETLNPKRVIHWIGAIFFGVCVTAEILLFLILNCGTYGFLKICMYIAFGLVALVLFWLLVIGRSGLMEMIPLALLQILVTVINVFPDRQLEKQGNPKGQIKAPA